MTTRSNRGLDYADRGRNLLMNLDEGIFRLNEYRRAA